MNSIFDKAFDPYGKVVEGYDFSDLLDTLQDSTDCPSDHVIYIPSEPSLEQLPVFSELRDRMYGGMPIQIGYCNGFNTKLNCLEYHRDSEVNIAANDIVLLLAKLQDVNDGMLDTALVEAFTVPAGCAVQLYETTLHYAPAHAENSFRVAVVLPRGTNTEKPDITPANQEDTLLWACNKWLIAHADTNEAKSGAFVGLQGKNLDISK